MKNVVAIAASFILIFVLTFGTADAAMVSKTTVYVENTDDDSLWVKFYLDGSLVKSVTVYQKSTKYIGYYQLSAGPHELKIEWKDPDTCEWREKTETINAAGGEVKTTTLSVVASNESTCKIEVARKPTSYTSLDISVRNADDDNLFIMLFFDGVHKKDRTVGPNTTIQFIKISSLSPGTHNLRIRWKEPDTNEWYEKTYEANVTEGDNNITLETDELIYTHEFAKPTSAIDISVENVDDDDLWVGVYVDSGYGIRYIRSGTKRHVRNFDNLYPGKHKVWIRWIDPDVLGWQEKKFDVYIGPNEELTGTYNTTKTIYVRKY